MSLPTFAELTAGARSLMDRTIALLERDPRSIAEDIAQFAVSLDVIGSQVTEVKGRLLTAMQANPGNPTVATAFSEVSLLEGQYMGVRQGWLEYVQVEPLAAVNGDPEVGVVPAVAGVVITVAVAALGIAIACSAMGVAWAYAHWAEVARQREAIDAMRANPALAPYLTDATKPADPPGDGMGAWVAGGLLVAAAAGGAWWWFSRRKGA